MKKYFSIAFVPVLIAFIVAVWAYGALPESVATHWNINGDADGYSSRFTGAWMLPIVMLGAYGLLRFMPLIDPKTKNIEKFGKQLGIFILIFEAFFLYLYGLTLYWNIVEPFSFVRPMILGIAGVTFGMAYLVKHAEQNYTIGIRTPWTLASKEVWRQTHQTTAKLFLAAGIVMLAGLVWPMLGFWLVIGSLVAVSVFALAYSYLVYSKTH